MCLLSCFFGQGARRGRPAELEEFQKASPLKVQVPPAEVKTPCIVLATEATTGTGCVNTAPSRSNDDTVLNPQLHDRPSDSIRGSPVASQDSLAAQLLDGLTFSTRVLGIGAYGIVLRGSFNGLDVAVKVMVSSRRANRAAVQEVALGNFPALTHPHICKACDTRTAVMTNALFDELEAHRERQRQQRRMEQQRLMQQQQLAAAMTATGGVSGGGSGSGGGDGNDARQPRTSTDRRPPGRPRNHNGQRLLQFYTDQGDQGPNIDRLRPLESCVPYAVLHEVLYRLGAVVGHSVTMVVMEHCSKGNLSRAIHRGIFEPCDMWGPHVAMRALVRTSAEMARALLHLHKAGVVHGDIKPGNVLLASSRSDRRGFVAKICDFGLSHLLPDGATSVDTNTWGTPAYMAPEALLGHAGMASDVWSFGVMLSEALTRQRPYGDALEPARLVIGILDGSLELAWPAVRSGNEARSVCADADGDAGAAGVAGGDPGLGTAARLARQCGLVFPATRSSFSIVGGTAVSGAGSGVRAVGTAGGTAAWRSPSSIMGTFNSTVTDGTTATSGTSVAGTTMLNTMTGTEVAGGSGGCSGGGGGGCSGGGGGGGVQEDLDCVLACLVNLGRRCTSRDPALRPCFSEVLGELIDMEIILKTSRPNRITAQPESQEFGVRARSRLGMPSAAAPPPPAVGIAGQSPVVQRSTVAAAAAAVPAAETAAVEVAAADRWRPAGHDLLDELMKTVVSYQAAFAAELHSRAAKAEAAAGPFPASPVPVPLAAAAAAAGVCGPLAPEVPMDAAAAAGGTGAVAAAAGTGAVAAAAGTGAVTAAALGGDEGDEILVMLPQREASLQLPPPPLAAAAAAVQPLLAALPVLPPEVFDAGAVELGVGHGDDRTVIQRAVGQLVVVGPAVAAVAADAAGSLALGPDPGTPDVSEACCVLSKVSQEPLA